VAIKVYEVRRDQLDEGAFRRFHREVAALRSLDGHPHVVRLVEADFTVDGHGFVATEWCTRTLADLIQSGPVPVAEALRLGVQIAEGLAAVHGTEPSILHPRHQARQCVPDRRRPGSRSATSARRYSIIPTVVCPPPPACSRPPSLPPRCSATSASLPAPTSTHWAGPSAP
jgi:serine/threonine protein kinase